MGKPFGQELRKIEDTYTWARKVQVTPLLHSVKEKNVWVIGSGGSSSACELLTLLQFHHGGIGIPLTPLELQYKKNAVNQRSTAVFISASGKNTDILFAFDTFIQRDPERVVNICFKPDSPLKKNADKYSVAETIEFEIPSGKDGFLATNSLIAYFTLLPRLYGHESQSFDIQPNSNFLKETESFAASLYEDFTITVLYAGWGKPAAVDIESKFSEAGLGNILLADYRNFGHGRHNWFDKKKKQSAIIALVTPDEEDLAKKTIGLLPQEIPVLFVRTEQRTSNASLDLLVQSFFVVESFGKKSGIDPGRPGVPDYGSKLYKLKYSKLYQAKHPVLTDKELHSISRKVGNINSLTDKQVELWKGYCSQYKTKLTKTSFKGVILDYDGTICSSEERFSGPRKDIQDKLNAFLRAGLMVALVTGRGKSVKDELRKFIEKEYWNKLVIGYYNGSQKGLLSDDALPVRSSDEEDVLKNIYDFLKKETLFSGTIKPELRKGQLTIEIEGNVDIENEKRIMIDMIRNNYPFNVQVLESSHSIDIIHQTTSKVSIIQYCQDLLNDSKNELNFLCIGDRGRWPGNDYQLLATPNSLSVDQVSADPYTCWNFAANGNRYVEATLEYFNAITIRNSLFTIKI